MENLRICSTTCLNTNELKFIEDKYVLWCNTKKIKNFFKQFWCRGTHFNDSLGQSVMKFCNVYQHLYYFSLELLQTSFIFSIPMLHHAVSDFFPYFQQLSLHQNFLLASRDFYFENKTGCTMSLSSIKIECAFI